jgi:hypothetical protein
MRAKSIAVIRDILIQKTQISSDNYQTTKDSLEQKYHSEWLDGIIGDSDQKILNDLRSKYSEISSVLEDFENHQW